MGWFQIKLCIRVLKKFQRFPIFAAPADFLANLGVVFPPLIIAAIFGVEEAGLYGLAQRFFGAPLAFIGQSIGQVFLGEGSRLLNTNFRDFGVLFFRAILVHFLLSLVFIAPVGLISNDVLILFFGNQWEGIGKLVYILLPMFIFQFVASPLSNTLAILGKQKLMLQIDFIRFSFFVALVAAVNFYISDFFTFLLAMSILNSIYYSVLVIATAFVFKPDLIRRSS